MTHVDAWVQCGGTKTDVAIASENGVVARAVGGTGNMAEVRDDVNHRSPLVKTGVEELIGAGRVAGLLRDVSTHISLILDGRKRRLTKKNRRHRPRRNRKPPPTLQRPLHARWINIRPAQRATVSRALHRRVGWREWNFKSL
jgi:hypothetical protein